MTSPRIGRAAAWGSWPRAPESARVLQARLRVPLTERVLMPETSDLPEFMPEPEFKRRFGGVGGPEYVRMMADIESAHRRAPALSVIDMTTDQACARRAAATASGFTGVGRRRSMP